MRTLTFLFPQQKSCCSKAVSAPLVLFTLLVSDSVFPRACLSCVCGMSAKLRGAADEPPETVLGQGLFQGRYEAC